jgi:hypothetical protein
MEKKNRKSNNNNSKFKRSNRIITTISLPMIVRKNLLSAHKMQTLKLSNNNISSISGSSSLQFAGTGLPTIPIASALAACPLFVSALSSYQYFRINGIKLEVQRCLADSDITAVFPSSGALPTVFLNFSLYSTNSLPTTGAVIQSSTSLEVDPFVSTRQRVSFNFPPILAYNTTTNAAGSVFIYNAWNVLTSNYTNMPGAILLNNSNVGVATMASPLYTTTLFMDVEFAGDETK